MPKIGQTLSHFKIVEKIGEGGMGTVFLADDLTLDRKVALKFLPDAFTSDPERMARFEREAKLLASLNHPNIAGIYGLEQADGNRFLVLEYVEGETLQARLSKVALPLDDALELCRQIAEGLESAHEKGVIHRDLKPANVMITAEEKIKILDFGLAKAFSDDTQSIDSSQSPTLTEAMTRPGVILGTAAYMSPEQAKGKSVDKRADIWAFGCILYECLTGKRAFEGESVTETLAAVIKEEPDIEKAPVETRLLLQQCLVKDRKKRLRDIGDAMAWIEKTPDVIESNPVRWPWLAWSVAILASLFAIILAFQYFHNQERKNAMIFPLATFPMPVNTSYAISPDGKWITYVAASSESSQSLYICETISCIPRELDGTNGAKYPFWSPDSQFIGFFTETKLRRIKVTDESPMDICEVSAVKDSGTWNDEGVIIFPDLPVLRSVSVEEGKPVTIITHEEFPDTAGYGSPCFLPDGRHYLFSTWCGVLEEDDIYLGSLDSDEKIKIVDGSQEAYYAAPGYIIYQREGKLSAQAFDTEKYKLTGKATTIADNLATEFAQCNFSASKNGMLIYRSTMSQAQSQFVWFDRDGNNLGPAGKAGRYRNIWDLSHDENKILVVLESQTTAPDISLFEWKRDALRSVTFNPVAEAYPVWSPKDERFGFSALIAGRWDIFMKKIGDPGEGDPIVNSAEDEYIKDWSMDNQYIAYTSSTDIYIYPLSGDKNPRPIVQRPSNQDDPAFSYNGKWLAYSSDESLAWQIYIVRIDASEEPRLISADDEGFQPQWKENDEELFYLRRDGVMMSVDLANKLEPGRPQELFNTGLIVEQGSKDYSVTGDGERFLLRKPLTETAFCPINLVINWPSLLKP
jgi:serine/threonine protein kinase